uniref:NAD(P)-bd_dom domain-containing protein n=1 Tax=Elaeophora elaphi TaxID=1147741 RepID=A0A0R3S6S9_9BILA
MADDLNYLIVGGLGYIGLHIAEYLLEKYSNVNLTILDLSYNTVYANEILKKVENYPQQCTVTIGSSCNSELVKKILEERRINTVLYNVWNDDVNTTAAKEDHPGCFFKTLSCLTQFLEILRCYGKLTKFIFISSEEVYGKQAIKLETTAAKPYSLKGAAINASEVMLHSYITSYRIPALTVRLSAVIYGGVMDDNSLLYLQQNDNGNSETVGLLHIQDAVVGIGAALERGQVGEVYNIGGQCDCSPHFVQLIAKLKKGEITSDEISISLLTMSSMKAELELLWKAKISQSEGIREIMVKNENHWNEMNGASTHKILVYGSDFALKRLSRLIENKKRYLPESLPTENIIIRNRQFDSGDVDINEIIDVSPSHIVYINIPNTLEIPTHCTKDAIDRRALLKTKLYAMLYTPWYLASFCDKRSIHFTYLTSDNPSSDNFFGLPHSGIEVPHPHFDPYDYLMAIDKFADLLLQHFDNILFCRAVIVINNENEVHKKTCFGLEPSLYLSFLSNCIAPVLDLALKGRTGIVGVLNPIPLDDYDFREVCNRGNRPLGASIEFVCLF